MPQEEIEKWLRIADEKGFPLTIHANGDAAIDQIINAVKKVRGDWPRADLRTTIIHAQTIRDDQLNFVANNGLVLSLFPIHIKFWGDRHVALFLGPERANRLEPVRSALDREIRTTIHHDAPIASWGMLPVVSDAVNRETSGGKALGPDERISIYEAFRAVTKDAAWQFFEENRKGTLEAGKLADMVVLDRDPLTVDPKKIRDIKVMETIKEGKTVYRKK
jgi:predicted amidohydrolase YtcJ